MGTQRSLLGTLVIIWFVVGLVAAYAYSCDQRRRGFLALALGTIATLALLGGEKIIIITSRPPVSGYVDIGIGLLFCLMMFDGIRGIRRNGVKPLALAALLVVLVAIAVSFITY